MERLRVFDDIHGKTVGRHEILSVKGTAIALVFTDDTFLVVTARSYYDSEYTYIEEDTDALSLRDQASIGLVTQEAYQAAVQAEKQEREAHQQALTAYNERREYERLKAKFENS